MGVDRQDKPYDNGAKRLLELCAQDFLDWQAPGAVFTGRRSEAFQSLFAGLAFTDKEDQEWARRRLDMMNDFLEESPVYQHILAKGEAKGKKERVLSLRGKILTLVQARFPQLKTLADQQVGLIEMPDPLEDMLLEIGMAQSVEEAQRSLQKTA